FVSLRQFVIERHHSRIQDGHIDGSMPVVSLIQNALLAAGEMANNYESSQHLAETLDFYRGLLPNAGF
ncbi:hypothetical protein, partial [Stenotrophomonas maltophilia]|uniref:hypothetical protein n=1 Tax=Stenotrophomonas maltophilia TaxID=40324 RepID=UPI0013D99748